MAQKPKIQYIGQFYVHGSEARALELEERRKNAKTKLPLARLQQIEKIYIDPVAIFGIVAAAVMLVAMVMGMLQLKQDWAEYDRMSRYVTYLNAKNEELTQDFRDGYDLVDIETKALAMGMVSKSELSTKTVTVTVPEAVAEPTRLEELRIFLEGLFA